MRMIVVSLLVGIVATSAVHARAEGSCEQVDFNEDGVVNQLDIDVVRSAMGASIGDPDYIAAADVDESGVITPVDFAILLTCR